MKTFEITKEQINILAQQHSWSEKYLKENFPQAFESELEVGKWYKITQCEIICFVTHIKEDRVYYYGFISKHWLGNDWANIGNNWTLATDKEVETALIEEAKRRGFKEGVTFKNFNGANQTFLSFYGLNESFNGLFSRTPKEEWGNKNCNSNPYIFRDGKWAEIINEPLTLTIDEIAEKFGTTADKIKICK